jgi:DNA-binding IclR family transcriptional regulator
MPLLMPSKTPVRAPASVAAEAPRDGAQTVRRALALMRLVAAAQDEGLRLADLATMSGLSRPTVHRLLKTLIDESAIEQDAHTRRYRIGTELLMLGLARPAGLHIRAVAEPGLQQLAQQVGDTVFLSVRQGADSVCIARYMGHHPIQVLSIEVGARRPLGASVSGVALLSGLKAAEAEALMVANAPRLQRVGIELADLRQRVAQTREQGHTGAVDGVVAGTRAISVPVAGAAGEVQAALSVAALAQRLDAASWPAVCERMRQQAAEITRRLQDAQNRRGRWRPAS